MGTKTCHACTMVCVRHTFCVGETSRSSHCAVTKVPLIRLRYQQCSTYPKVLLQGKNVRPLCSPKTLGENVAAKRFFCCLYRMFQAKTLRRTGSALIFTESPTRKSCGERACFSNISGENLETKGLDFRFERTFHAKPPILDLELKFSTWPRGRFLNML